MDVNGDLLEIKTSSKSFFYQYLMLKKPVIEMALSNAHKKKISLQPKVMLLFALLLYYNNEYRDLDDETKWMKLFNGSTKKQLMAILKVNESQLNTYFSVLRRYNLVKGRTINESFIVYPQTGFELTFKFLFQDEK